MNQTIGEKIAALRKAKNITQTQLAEYLFLVPQTISKWEVGNGTPDVAMLPKIADFFGVSMDELFGRSPLDRAKDLVMRYSVLRDDSSFREAMECLKQRLQTIDSLLKNGIGDRSQLEQEKVELEGNEMHLLLQQGWESAQRALDLAEDLANRTGEMPFRLQRVQLNSMLGHNRQIRLECEKNFREAPGLDTLRLYYEVLLILGQDETILQMQETEETVMELMMPPSRSNADIWNQCLAAAFRIRETGYIEKHKDTVLHYGTAYDRFSLLWKLAELYKEKNLMEKYIAARKEVVSMMPEMKWDAYVEERMEHALQQL
ncbi:MAG: helix-turn-helix domain-containing protein [Acetatifactor sp.]|nr:helix-turn-helix domain-containing protein [Acetatifactor sp.]